MKKIALFASHKVGLEVIKHILEDNKSKINYLYLINKEDYYSKQIINMLKNKCNYFIDIVIRYGKDSWQNDYKKFDNIDVLLTIYWPWILPKKSYQKIQVTCNFHPAFLPQNRGWYPHVHNILEGTTPGVTLHELEENADTGDILAQEVVTMSPKDTAFELYNRLQESIINLFKTKWYEIRDNLIKRIKQDETNATYNSKKKISEIDYIDINKYYKGGELLNLLKARSFGNRGFAYSIENKKKYYYKILISEDTNFKL